MFVCQIMPYQRGSWFEPQSQAIEHGLLPVNWNTTLYRMEVVRWPSQRNVEVMIRKEVEPDATWQIFILVHRIDQPSK